MTVINKFYRMEPYITNGTRKNFLKGILFGLKLWMQNIQQE